MNNTAWRCITNSIEHTSFFGGGKSGFLTIDETKSRSATLVRDASLSTLSLEWNVEISALVPPFGFTAVTI
jgi:hypothetical protein